MKKGKIYTFFFYTNSGIFGQQVEMKLEINSVALPNIPFPRYGYPEITNVWEWSAVTTIKVSWVLVMDAALSTARSIATTSCNDLTGLLPW